MSNADLLIPVPLESIIAKVQKFHTTMNGFADLAKNAGPTSLQIDKEHAFLQYYISKESFKNLVTISEQENFDGFVVFFGMEEADRYNKLTAIMIGANDKQNILNQHKEPHFNYKGEFVAPLPVDEQNPPPPYSNGTKDVMPSNCFTLNSNWADVDAFFRKKDPNQVSKHASK